MVCKMESGPTIGAFTRPWNQFPLEQAFETIRDAGFNEIGMMPEVIRIIR